MPICYIYPFIPLYVSFWLIISLLLYTCWIHRKIYFISLPYIPNSYCPSLPILTASTSPSHFSFASSFFAQMKVSPLILRSILNLHPALLPLYLLDFIPRCLTLNLANKYSKYLNPIPQPGSDKHRSIESNTLFSYNSSNRARPLWGIIVSFLFLIFRGGTVCCVIFLPCRLVVFRLIFVFRLTSLYATNKVFSFLSLHDFNLISDLGLLNPDIVISS